MAVEARRGCGYRKVGGMYLIGSGLGVSCDRLPFPLTVCPCCSSGFKQSRGWTWIDVNALMGGVHRNCADEFPCPLCMATPEMGRVGLLWIGERFYGTPGEFCREADELGVSRRIAAIPRGLKIGETWVLLAHPRTLICTQCGGAGMLKREVCGGCKGFGKVAGIFRVFRPTAIEKIITETESQQPWLMEDLQKRGIKAIVVPDNDPDHQGTVYESEEVCQ